MNLGTLLLWTFLCLLLDLLPLPLPLIILFFVPLPSLVLILFDSVQDIDEVALQHIDSPDFVEPGLERAANDENFGDLEINLLADPASWCPFPSQSQILRQNGKTIGFRTKSGIMFGPKRIEIMADTLANNGCVQIYCP